MRSALVDREPYVQAHRTYDDLHDLIGSLSNKLSDVSAGVDKEFLASYRVHMLSIQSEIKELTDEVNRGVQALNSDGDVAKLEKEVNWFIDESTRLRVHYNSMEKDCQQMLSRLQAMNEQKVYLNEQLKAIMKRNRVLQAEIDYAKQFELAETEQEDGQGSGVGSPPTGWGSPAAGRRLDLDDAGYGFGGTGDGGDADADADGSLWEGVDEDEEEDDDDDGGLVQGQGEHSLKQLHQKGMGAVSSHSSESGSWEGTKEGDVRVRAPSSGAASPSSPVASRPYQEELLRQASEDLPLASANFLPVPRKIGSPSSRSRGGGSRGGGSRGGGGKGGNGTSAPSGLQLPDEEEEYVREGSASSRLRIKSPEAAAYVLGKKAVAQRSTSAKFQASVAAGGGTTQSLSASSRSFDGSNNSHRGNQQQLGLGPDWGGFEGYHATPVHLRSKQRLPKPETRISKGALLPPKREEFPGAEPSGVGEMTSTRNRTKLKLFLKNKCPYETQLEIAAADIFREIRARKVHAAQRGSVKRYPVSMTGGLPGDPGTQAAAAATAAAATAAAAWTGVGAGEAGVDDTEDALLGVPLIEATGGISGMGLHQFSDNDKLSCIVKFLLKRDAFKEVVQKLQDTLY